MQFYEQFGKNSSKIDKAKTILQN